MESSVFAAQYLLYLISLFMIELRSLMTKFRAPFMLVEESQVVMFGLAIYRNNSYVKKVGHFIEKRSCFGPL